MPITRRTFIEATGAAVAAGGTALTVPGQRAAAAAPPSLRYTAGTGMSATATPDGKRLVMEVQGHLWSLPRTGGRAKRLTEWELEPTRPALSPDGSQLAVCAFRSGGFHLWLMAPDGSGLRQLTDGPWDDRGVAWSPDGTKLAFASERGTDAVKGGSYTIWTIDVRSGALAQVTKPGAVEDYDPAWTPHGKRLVFVRAARLAAGGNDGGLALMSAPVGGGEARTERTVTAGSLLCPSVGPGGRIAYVRLTPADAGHPKPRAALEIDGKALTDGEDVFPATPRWLDGDRLLYAADGALRERPAGGGDAKDIPFTATLAVDTPSYRGKRHDFDSTDRKPVRGIHLPALSPDGKSIAFVALNALWLLRIGGRPRKLVQEKSAHYLHMPSWAADGRSIVYTSDRDGLAAVYRHTIADGSEELLAAGGRLNPALSPDGERLASEDSTGVIYVKDLRGGTEKKLATPIGANGLPGRPSWSADGRRVAICDRNRLNQRFREGYNLIRVIDAESGDSAYHLLADHQSIADRCDSGPVWSPDGRWMACIAESALWVLPVTPEGAPTGPARRITRDDEAADHPSWAGDSRTLCYLSSGRLRLIDRDGGGRREVAASLTYRRRIPPRTDTTRIHAGRLWDGTGDTVREDVDVVLRGNRIVSVGPHRGDGARGGETYLDCSRRTVLPGLWDAHTHPWQYTYGGRQTLLNLAYGVTANASLGGFAHEAVRLRESLASGDTTGPRLLATGELIDGPRVAYSMGRAHRTREGVARTLGRAVALDYDFVKTYVRAPGSTMAAAARTAHDELGVPAGSHLCYPGRNLGQDLTTHLQATQRLEYGHATSTAGRAYQDLLEEYRDGHFRLIATPFTALPLLGADPDLAQDPRVTVLMPPWDTAVVQQTAKTAPTAAQLAALETEIGIYRRVVDAGGALVLGTDQPLVPIGLHLHLGLRALHRYGFSAAEALHTATVAPARVFGVADDLGTVQEGRLADLTVVDGDPFTDFAALVDTAYAIRDGIVHRPADLVDAYAHSGERHSTKSHDSWLAVGRELRRDACCAEELSLGAP
ncbi:amidohydrolase family protein [Streptomyces boninensis]|uniref:amidohydrolase family protein n=1 Tax=Streptomyces boninensis TaxID=2039455 RepID=UPI003B20FF49